MTDPAVTHRPMNSDTLELEHLPPAERERVEEVMAQIQADMERICEENFIGTQTEDTLVAHAERLVASWNADSEGLRSFAEAMTGNPVESCTVVFDGVADGNMLISYQVEFAKQGEHVEAWDERYDGARAAAKRVLDEELPEDAFERKDPDSPDVDQVGLVVLPSSADVQPDAE